MKGIMCSVLDPRTGSGKHDGLGCLGEHSATLDGIGLRASDFSTKVLKGVYIRLIGASDPSLDFMPICH